ncbi:MAG: ATP-dependent Clp protease adaptor ClpS [Nitrospinales bacterium]
MGTKTIPLPEVEEESRDKVKQGYLPLYRVIMWNDDITTMEFVIRMLMRVFVKDYPSAEKLMYEVHYEGSAHVDTQPLERAEFKVDQVHSAASLEGFPLKCTIEPV